jgi:hypothetical protein
MMIVIDRYAMIAMIIPICDTVIISSLSNENNTASTGD